MTNLEAINPIASEISKDKEVRPYSIISRQNAYTKLNRYMPIAINSLGKLIKSKSPMIRLGALKLYFSKVLPDLKSMDLTGNTGNQFNITVNMGNGYNPLKEDSTIIDATNVPSTPITPVSVDYTRSQPPTSIDK